MENKDLYQPMFDFIRSVIVSAEQVLPVLSDKELMNDTMIDSVFLILEHTKKQLKLLPELLVYGENLQNPKDKLIKTLKVLMDLWISKDFSPEEITKTWKEFTEQWLRYETLYVSMQNSKNTIVMSLN